MKPFKEISLTGVVALALAVSAFTVTAADTSAQGTSFRGKVSSVDKDAKTLTINSQSYQVLPTTRIMKDNQPVDFDMIQVGEQLSGVYKKSAENKMELLMLNVDEAVGGTSDSSDTTSGQSDQSGESFSGKVSKVNAASKTVTIDNETYYVLPTSRITVGNKPATFTQIQSGKQVSGNYKESAENHKEILSLNIGSAVGGTKNTASKESGTSFYGTITKVDPSAQTFNIGRRTFQILQTTHMVSQTGGDVDISNLKVGQKVSGTYKQSAEGKMEVLSLDVGGSKP